MSNMTQAQQARIRKHLDSRIICDGVTMTHKKMIEDKLAQGWKILDTLTSRISEMSRRAINRSTNEEIADHDYKRFSSGFKHDYIMYDPKTDAMMSISKICYDHARSIVGDPEPVHLKPDENTLSAIRALYEMPMRSDPMPRCPRMSFPESTEAQAFARAFNPIRKTLLDMAYEFKKNKIINSPQFLAIVTSLRECSHENTTFSRKMVLQAIEVAVGKPDASTLVKAA